MYQEFIITGAKPSKGNYEGRPYDSTKIYVQTKMDDNGSGYATAEYKWGDSTNFEKIKDLEYPFKAQVEMEVVTSGTMMRFTIVDVKPVNAKTAKNAE